MPVYEEIPDDDDESDEDWPEEFWDDDIEEDYDDW